MVHDRFGEGTLEMARRRGFGKLRGLPSGRYQASYVGPDLRRHNAPTTFETKLDAEGWLRDEYRMIERDEWTAPVARSRTKYRPGSTLSDFAPGWLEAHKRSDGQPLKERTREHYGKLLNRRILPHLGELPMRSITEDRLTQWLDRELPRDTPVANAHAYALCSEILRAAARKDPMIKLPMVAGASKAKTTHKADPASLEELTVIVDNMPERHRLAVLLMAWCALRFGEVTELRRRDLVLSGDNPRIKVRRAVVLVGGRRMVTTPKSEAGDRDVTIPPHLLDPIRRHLDQFTESGPDGLLFTAEHGGHLALTSLNGKPARRRRIKGRMVNESASGFCKAREAAGRPDLHIHDLRHTGAVLAAQVGATLPELMERLGHSTPAAAMRYQHVARGRARAVADALSVIATANQ